MCGSCTCCSCTVLDSGRIASVYVRAMNTNDSRAGDLTSSVIDETIRETAHLTRAERRAIGEAYRQELPLEAHVEVAAPDRRRDPIAILSDQDTTRRPELVPIRHGRMSATAFTFYRGSAAVMASDLSMVSSSGIGVQLCGDAHLANFGVFKGPDRRLVFDLNDFDETHPGPFEWDVKRLAASLFVAARDHDLPAKKAAQAAQASVYGYRRIINQVVGLDPLALHYYRIEVEQILANLDEDVQRKNRKLVDKAQRKSSLLALEKMTEVVNGKRRIVDDPPLVVRLDVLDHEVRHDVESVYEQYLASLPLARRRVIERYRIVDIARKVVGVGSVGTRCLIVLLETGDGEPLFLQFKQATASVLEPYLGATAFAQAGQRVVEGQRLMQAASDVFLGWARFDSPNFEQTVDFYFRQLWDGKASAEIDTMGGRHLRLYGELCGGTLALAHARTGDAAMIGGYLGDDDTFDRAVAEFAASYADITDRDHAAHLAAIESGAVAAVRDL
jgi:uncharacterized protein (DUF2252 family)